MKADGETLWLYEVNKKANSFLSKVESAGDVSHHHKRILKFISKQVTSKRTKLFAKRDKLD